jgi:hypothetical protein
MLVLGLLALLVLGSGGAALLKVGPFSSVSGSSAVRLTKPGDPRQAVNGALQQISGFKDVKMKVTISIDTGGHLNDQTGILSEIARPVLIDIRINESSVGAPYEEIQNPISGATCMIDNSGQMQVFHGRPQPTYAEPLVKTFKSVLAWHYLFDANKNGDPGQEFWRVEGDLPGLAFPGRAYSSSTAEVYISTRTGRFDTAITDQVYTTNGGPRTVFIGTQDGFVFNNGVHIKPCA